MKEKNFVSIVAYVHDCSKLVDGFLSKVMTICDDYFQNCELIMVNDASNDDSRDRIVKYYDEKKQKYIVSIVDMGNYQGLESSMNAGRDLSIGDYVFEFDDLVVDYDPQIIIDAYKKCLEGYDVVAVSEDTRLSFSSRLFYSLYNKVKLGNGEIGQETLRVLTRRGINRVKEMGMTIPYRKAVYANSGLRVSTIKYKNNDSNNSLTKHSHKGDRLSLAVDSFIYFTDFLEKVSVWICVAFFVIMISVLVYVLYSLVADANLQSGWTSLMGYISIGFFGIFLLQAIIVRYLSVLVNLVFKKRHYMVENIEKIARD